MHSFVLAPGDIEGRSNADDAVQLHEPPARASQWTTLLSEDADAPPVPPPPISATSPAKASWLQLKSSFDRSNILAVCALHALASASAVTLPTAVGGAASIATMAKRSATYGCLATFLTKRMAIVASRGALHTKSLLVSVAPRSVAFTIACRALASRGLPSPLAVGTGTLISSMLLERRVSTTMAQGAAVTAIEWGLYSPFKEAGMTSTMPKAVMVGAVAGCAATGVVAASAAIAAASPAGAVAIASSIWRGAFSRAIESGVWFATYEALQRSTKVVTPPSKEMVREVEELGAIPVVANAKVVVTGGSVRVVRGEQRARLATRRRAMAGRSISGSCSRDGSLIGAQRIAF